MRIANPIYDIVFKYLMQNNEIATLILSTILEEEILSLNLLPQETAMEVEDEILAEFEDIERRMAGMEKTLEENAKALEEKDQAIEEKDRALEEKERELAEKDRLIMELRGSR